MQWGYEKVRESDLVWEKEVWNWLLNDGLFEFIIINF